MSQQPKQQDESGQVHPSPALQFVKGATTQPKSKKDVTIDDASQRETVQIPEQNKQEKQKKIRAAGHGRSKPNEKELRLTYEPFSTRLRQDLKRRLKRLSHHREDSGHKVFKVQQFVEEAISEWLALQDEPTITK